MKTIEFINNLENVPAAAPYYSQVVWAGNTAYFSGLVGISSDTGKLVDGGISNEAEQIFDNIENILKGIKLELKNIVKVTIYLTDINDFAKMNEVYIKRMLGNRPARETVAVKGLAINSSIEITITAYKD